MTVTGYANEHGLGFGISSINERETKHRASDVGGSEILFRCTADTRDEIVSAINEDETALPGDPEDDSDDTGLIAFWGHVERHIRRHAKIVKP